MQAVSRLEHLEPLDRRIAQRRRMSLGTVLSRSGDDVTIHDLSATGMLIQTRAQLSAFDELEVELPEHGSTVAIVAWTSGEFFGCQFASAIPKSALSAALLRNPVSPPAAEAPIETPAEVPAKAAEERDESGEQLFETDKYSLTVRLRVILGSSLLLWALVLWAVGII